MLLAVGGSGASAETLRYAMEVPDGSSVTYTLELDVRHSGPLSVRAEWTGGRILSLKLEPPNKPWGKLLRSGPSPQVLAAEADRSTHGTWKLLVNALAARGGGEGMLTIELPEPARAAKPDKPAAPMQPPPAEPDPWLRPEPIPRGLPSQWLPFFHAAERFRAELTGTTPDALEDTCRWQSPLMRYLAEWRDRLVDEGAAPHQTTVWVLKRIVEAIGAVEGLRSSDDPLVNGPAPQDPALRNTWLKLRSTKVRPVETELDLILGLVQRDYSPELAREDWPIRLVSCLTACERYFEQRARLGEERAGNRDLAVAQWSRLLAAGEALEALSRLKPRSRAAQRIPD